MSIKRLLIVTAVIEVGAGLVLVISPAVMVSLLLGSAFDTSGGLVVGRLAGAALLSLALACWRACDDERSRAAAGLVAAMLLYNLAAVSIFASAGFGSWPGGVALWSAVVLHAAMAVWCIACLKEQHELMRRR